MKTQTTNAIPQCTAEFRAELAKVWAGDARMIDFCAKAEHAYMLPSGRIYTIEVPRIETHFCFGYSTADDGYEDATRMARHARTHSDYFIEENIRQSRLQEDFAKWEGMDENAMLARYVRDRAQDVKDIILEYGNTGDNFGERELAHCGFDPVDF